jgi:hypothetical protein
MSASVLLSQETTSLTGVNLKWVYTGLASSASTAVKEISLIYYQNTSDADIKSIDVPSGVLRTNLASGLVSGQSYTFQLQVGDVANNILYSNALQLTAPWVLTPPVLTAVTGFDSSLRVQLASTANILVGAATVEFVLKRDDNVAFWIIKPFSASGTYMLGASDDARLENNTTYRVACMFQPSSSNSRYNAPSAISNTISAVPNNTPNAPSAPAISSVGVGQFDINMTWSRPSDFSEWASSGYVITLKRISSFGEVITQTFTNQDVIQYLWSNVAETRSYVTTVQYSNVFGDGPVSATSNSVLPTRIPNLPGLSAVSDSDQVANISWFAPNFDGQSAITGYKLYKGANLLASLPASTMSFQDTGLQNGASYSYSVSAVNSIGESAQSSSLTARPYGQMYIVSVLASGKTITATMNPNGRPITNVVLIAVDQDPNNVLDSEFVIAIPQQEISQVTSSNVTVIKNFSGFTSDIAFFCCIAHNATNSVFYKSVVA